MVDGAAVGGLNPVSAFALVGALGVNAHRRSPDRLGVLAGRVPEYMKVPVLFTDLLRVFAA